MPTANVATGADDFAAGKTDAFSFALGSAKVKEIDAKVGGCAACRSSDAGIDRALRRSCLGPTTMKVNPAPRSRCGDRADRTSRAFDFLLVTSAKVPDDIVYQVTKAMHDGKDIHRSRPSRRCAQFDPDKMAAKQLSAAGVPSGARSSTTRRSASGRRRADQAVAQVAWPSIVPSEGEALPTDFASAEEIARRARHRREDRERPRDPRVARRRLPGVATSTALVGIVVYGEQFLATMMAIAHPLVFLRYTMSRSLARAWCPGTTCSPPSPCSRAGFTSPSITRTCR